MTNEQQDPHGVGDLLHTALYDKDGEYVEVGFGERWDSNASHAIEALNAIFSRHGWTEADVARIEQAIHAEDARPGAGRLLLYELGRFHLPIQELVRKALNDPLPRLRIAALQAGAYLFDPLFLLELLNDADATVRAATVTTLGEPQVERKVPDAQAHLARALDDTDPSVRMAAATAVQIRKDLAGSEALLRRLAIEPDERVSKAIIIEIAEKTRRAALHVGYAGRPPLRETLGEPVMQMLLRELNNPDAEVRQSVAAALERVGGVEVATAMLERLVVETDRLVRRALVHYPGPGYWRIAERALPVFSSLLLSDSDLTTRVDITYHLRAFGSAAAPALLAVLDDPTSNVQSAAAMTLGDVGDERAIPSLMRLLADPTKQRHHHSFKQAIRAIEIRAASKRPQ